MESILSRFMNLPGPAKAVFALASGVGLMGVAFLLLGDYPVALGILIGGIMLAGIIFILFRKFIKVRKKRKAAPLQQNIEANSAVAPQGVNAPEQRASMDDLRKNFQNGLDKFNAAGKDLYSLPWYVLVGEPGSGKTEAIRHCSVGFPPGLQDQLQGSGGTINMNWWFTNHAVILDTAGRLMFEDIEPGKANEWKEFLKLLRTFRPNCPINGMLLTIPANSIIKDNANEIEAKAGKIANQLDQIQRELGVRFPVSIIITKSDLIYGFREYFDDITDPQLQHQIMGWSNPAELDVPFRPENVKDYLIQVKQRIVNRRLALLQDPVNTDDPKARRMDQVDSLYSFPEGFEQIIPRLQRYLEMIFVAGAWSAKPLFLRGIYFTSSMREGSALDADLAEALNVSIDSLPEGKVWERERAYFLRDLFMDKVFKEKGLVTRASNAKKMQRQRRMLIMGFGFVSVIIFAALTFYFSYAFKHNLGSHVAFWSTLRTDYVRKTTKVWSPVIGPKLKTGTDFAYYGVNQLSLKIENGNGELDTKVSKIHTDIRDFITSEDQKIDPPWIFSLGKHFAGDLDKMRIDAARVLYNSAVMDPLVELLYRKLEFDTKNNLWSPKATHALTQILRLEAWSSGLYESGVTQKDNNAAAGKLINLSLLMDYVFEGYDFKDENETESRNVTRYDFDEDVKSLQNNLDWLYNLSDNSEEWQKVAASFVKQLNSKDTEIVSKALNGFINYWNSDDAGQSPEYAQIIKLYNTLQDYSAKETALLGIADGTPQQLDEYNTLKGRWNTNYKALALSRDTLTEDVKFLGARDLSALYKTAQLEIFNQAETQFKLIQNELHPAHIVADGSPAMLNDNDNGDSAAGSNKTLPREFKDMETLLAAALVKIKANNTEDKLNAVVTKLDEFKENILKTNADNNRRYSIRCAWYTTADSFVNNNISGDNSGTGAVDDTGKWFELASSLKQISQNNIDAVNVIGTQSQQTGMKDQKLTLDARTLADKMIDAATRADRYELVNQYLTYAPDTEAKYEKLVLDYVDSNPGVNHISRPQLPMCIELQSAEDTKAGKSPQYNSCYHPDVVKVLLDNWAEVKLCVTGDGATGISNILDQKKLATDLNTRDEILRQYLAGYYRYWTDTIELETSVKRYDDWKTFYKEVTYLLAPVVNNQLKSIAQMQLEALAAVPAADLKLGSDKQKVVTRLEKEIELLGNEGYMALCKDELRKWNNLSDNPSVARKTLLNTSEHDFIQDYIPLALGDNTNNSPSIKYWYDLTLCAIQTLATNSGNIAIQSIGKLRSEYKKFPLSKSAGAGNELLLSELYESQDLLLNITALSKDVIQNGNSSLLSSEGTLKNLGKISTAVNDLRNVNLDQADKDFVEGLKSVMSGLPDGGEADDALDCQVYIVDTGGADVVWRDMAMIQGAGRPNPQPIRSSSSSSVDLGVLKYPGSNVRFELYEKSILDSQSSFTVEGTWACIRMLHEYTSSITDKEGKEWDVNIPVVRDGNTYVIKLKLVFSKPLPPLRDWPE